METEVETTIMYLRAGSIIFPELSRSQKSQFIHSVRQLVQKMDELISDYRENLVDNGVLTDCDLQQPSDTITESTLNEFLPRMLLYQLFVTKPSS
mgnify:CR=1 FL=1